MVLFSGTLWAGKKMRNFMRPGFMDAVRVRVVGGDGGAGLPRVGGRGGQGGAVACLGVPHASLASIKAKHRERCVRAGHGQDSVQRMILGPPGEDVVLEVPPGITIFSGEKSLGEINAEGEQIVVAAGGEGGGPTNSWLGGRGEQRTLLLELRLIADVGLLGFPNAGKSTLLRAVSRAKPKVAAYPFTTIRPNIGTMAFPDLRQITVADLPGLVEGAHRNIGMGHRFLRHVERTKLLLMLVDINGFSLSAKHKHRTCLENILLLNKELEMYNPALVSKPAMLVVNKMDTPGAEEKFQQLIMNLKNIDDMRGSVEENMWPSELLQFQAIAAISARDGARVADLKARVRAVLDEQADREREPEADLEADLVRALEERGPRLT